MGKLSSFAAGMGEGYLGARRYLDTKDRLKKQDELFEKALAAGKATDPAKSADAPVTPAPDAAEDEVVEGFSASMFRPRRYTHGGMIGEMPHHFDKMSWQRQTFKKKY